MNAPITAAELRERLKQELAVEVNDTVFRIRRVPPLFLADESEDFWALARAGGLGKRAAEIAASPKLAQFRRILLYGVVQPKLGMGNDDPEAVPVDELIANEFETATQLYARIVCFTFERIAAGGETIPKEA
jgi:hypothetical protein